MTPTPQEILERIFGYPEFRGAQQAIVEHVLDGGDALVLMPTGGGKSLCYQIPALLRAGTGIVVSPLIALMQDQVNALRQLGVRAAFLNSSLSPEARAEVEDALLAGDLDLLYVAPERLLTEAFLALLERSRIALFAIDEAHCVSQWGHDFRPEYIQLGELHNRWPQVPRIALTATADTPTRSEILSRLRLQNAGQFVASFDRPNICYRIVEKQRPRQQLVDFLRAEHPHDAGIVYCLSRKKVDETTRFLQDQGFPALPYHAGMTAADRRTNQAEFLRGDGVVICATIAFGMGIDKPDVRFVAHLDLPKSIEAYYQETGRAGRDGLPANAWLCYGLSDVVALRRFIEQSEAEAQYKRVELHKLNALVGLCEAVECRRRILLNYFGETLAEPCGNCDTCLTPVATWDGSVAAQKAMSCIYRTGQRFGVSHLVDVLLGHNNTRIRELGHQRLSTYGIGKDLSAEQWKSVYRQLVALGLVEVDIQGYGALRLTAASRPVLRGEQSVRLRRDPERKRQGGAQHPATGISPADPEANALWERLRARRKVLATDQNIAPYMVFGDVTLREMVTYRPRSAAELAQLTGIGTVKLERYAADFLAELEAHAAAYGRPERLPALPEKQRQNLEFSGSRDGANGLSDTVHDTLNLFRQGQTVEQIASTRGIKAATVYTHLSRCIEAGELTLRETVPLAEDELQAIHTAFEAQPADSQMLLKPIYETFAGRYDYGLLRCVRAAMDRGE